MASVKELRPLAPVPTLGELLQTTPQLKKEDIACLQNWMSRQPHLPKVPDEMLVPFLHVNNYSPERAKYTIENYFTIRTHIPELFRNRDPLTEAARKQMTLCQGGHLHKNDADGNMVWISRLLPCNPSELDFDICFKLVMMTVDQAVREYPSCPGHVVIEDFKEVTMGHVAIVKLSTVRRISKYIQEALNVRVKALHVINISPAVDYLIQLFKPFLNKDLTSKIHMHPGSIEEFYKVVPREMLPKDYGGNDGDMAEIHDYTLRTLERNRDWFLENEFIVDETKRASKSKNPVEVSGAARPFKKLDID